ncbi:MAG: hypothetical protein LQ338_005155 [Usnochroma carphineum]|nr:MAG: hypothetical protein LQ338_005155 [Usnochroma carphineum]
MLTKERTLDEYTDIKPNNILANFGSGESLIGDIKLADFGDSVPEDVSTNNGQHVVGATVYRAPEMMLNARWTTAIDIWSLGATLIFFLVREHIFVPSDVEEEDERFPILVMMLQIKYFGPFPEKFFGLLDDEGADCLRYLTKECNGETAAFSKARPENIDPDDKDFISYLMQPDPRDRFCRAARTTSLLSDSVSCIRQNCTAGRPFLSTALLTPVEEKCKEPISPNILANANRLAAQDPAFSIDVAPSLASLAAKNGAKDGLAIRVIATTNKPSSFHDVTTTYIGIATDANGQQETFTVPALLVATGTVYGKPVTKVQGPESPTSTVTLPWPTLPVGYFSLSQSTPSRTTSLVQAPGLSTTATTTSAAAAGPSSTNSQKSQKTGKTSDEGTILDTSDGPKHGAGSSLGLMVVLMVGVVWF